MKAAILHEKPLQLKRRTAKTSKPFDIILNLNLSAGCKCSYVELKIPVEFEISIERLNEDKDSIIHSLKRKAIEDQCCGQTIVVEKQRRYNDNHPVGSKVGRSGKAGDHVA
ncbi:hypothetical protein F511_33176 [Dorcoceras hygrometricum]|uniref:Uncharacterized protein n=1 Tax=Dorcoceras hygrometricum TaxID=472368 RepID=A0A2Z7D102_9LAMI|nr:hypothetical protein F511_33176 [Dorcoceras hygrometricum]